MKTSIYSLIIFVMSLVPSLAGAQTKEVINLTAQGWEQGAELLNKTVEGKGCTVSFTNKGGKMGVPTYSGSWVSIFSRNNLTVTSKGKTIKSIEFVYGKGKPRTKVQDNGDNDINYKFNTGDYDEPTRTWTGEATAVTLTKKPGRGEIDVVRLTVTYAE